MKRREGRMTRRRGEVLAFIRDSTAERGYPPTVREIGRAVGLSSPSAVQYQLDTLQEQGLVTREHGRNRTVRLTLEVNESVGANG